MGSGNEPGDLACWHRLLDVQVVIAALDRAVKGPAIKFSGLEPQHGQAVLVFGRGA
jgi:hypothetical protein